MASRIIKKVEYWINSIVWIFKIARRPSRDDYFTVLKLGAIIIVALGTYSFIFNIAGALITGSAVTLPYPINIIVVTTVAATIIALLAALILSARRMGRRR
jgi:preprotein translocase subunit Sss1